MGSMRKYIVLAVASMALGLAPFALAADATTTVYGGAGKKTQDSLGVSSKPVVKGATASVSASTTPAAGALPFTGMNLGFIAIAGIALASVGYSLRRLGRDTDR